MQSGFSAPLAKQFLTLVPQMAKRPLAVVPFTLKAKLIAKGLSLVLAQQEQDDELAFLSGKWVAIQVTDIDLVFEVSFNGKWLVREFTSPDVTFMAQTQDLVLVASGQEDPDTLFFQRKLSIEGDTELGLEVKNLLLSVEFNTMPAPIRVAIEKCAVLIQKLQSQAEMVAY